MYYNKPSLDWWYCLYVPGVQGQVEGKYWNTTRNPEKVVYNLEKLVRLHLVENMNFETPTEEWQKKLLEAYFKNVDKWLKNNGVKN